MFITCKITIKQNPVIWNKFSSCRDSYLFKEVKRPYLFLKRQYEPYYVSVLKGEGADGTTSIELVNVSQG